MIGGAYNSNVIQTFDKKTKVLNSLWLSQQKAKVSQRSNAKD